MRNKSVHEREDFGIVSCSRQHELAVAERIRHGCSHIAACKVVDTDGGAAACTQLVCQQFYRLLCVSVNRGVGNDDAFFLNGVGRPGVVQPEIVAEIFREYGAVQRADGRDVECCRLFQHALHLRAVFADDTDVVASRLVRPGLVHVKRAEFAEAVGREKHLVGGVIGHDDLGPVHHGRGDKGKCVLAERECVALADHNAAVGIVGAEELLHHGKRLG